MRRALYLLVPVLSFLTMTGCKEVKIENGEIPSRYLAMAKRYTGVYKGQMEGQKGALTLALRGNKAVLIYASEIGNDLIDPRCQSQLGELKSVRLKENGIGDLELATAKFGFDPHRCDVAIQGREIILNFSPRGDRMRVSVAVLAGTSWESRCRIEPGNPAAGLPPREVCAPQATSEYLKGIFKR